MNTEVIQKRAEAAFSELPMPSPTDEKWRKTMVDEIDLEGLKPASPKITISGEKSREIPENMLGSLVGVDKGKFEAFNMARFTKLVKIELSGKTFLGAKNDAASVWRELVIAPEGENSTFVERIGGGGTFHQVISEVFVKENATLNYFVIQNFQSDNDFSRRAIKLEKNAKLNLFFIHLGAGKSKNWVDVDISGYGAEAKIRGLYLLDGRGHYDLETHQNHKARNSRSDLIFKGVLSDNSRAVYQGLISIAKGGDYSDAYQTNRNLLISPNARADSIPSLEILCEEVKCSHGASAGSLNDEEIFYAMSRGLDENTARNMLIKGYLSEVLDPFKTVLGGEVDVLVGKRLWK